MPVALWQRLRYLSSHAWWHLALAETGCCYLEVWTGTSVCLALNLQHSTHAQTTPAYWNEEVLQDGHWLGLLLTIRLQLALRHLRRDWYGLAWFYGLPGSAQSVPFCSPGMALADASVAGPCSHLSGPESSPDLRSSPASLQEVQLTAVLGAALLREASVSPFGSSFSYYVLPRDRRR